ncbi:MAG: hypothetical protein DRP56_00835 [Planctomycetota bacterium]|nr:MAG: hypothetical protein DRP56_00835 [Planctomycetota bacterium]
MSVRPHPTKGSGWWQIDTGRGKGRRRGAFRGSFEEAASVEAAMRQRRPEVVQGVAPKIKELFVPFLAWYRNESSPNTIRDIRFSIDLYFAPWFGNLQPAQLNLQLFNQFKASLLEKGLSPATINKHLNYFSSLIKWAVDHGHCQPFPFNLPRFPKKKTASAPVQPLTQRQVDALYNNIEPRYRLLFLLMADHGLRTDEALNLKVDDINEGNQTIRVRGKGNRYRQVPFMSDRFEDELNQVLGERLDGFLVINEKTGRPYATIWKPLKRAAMAAGITKKINHHLLRHSFATLAAQGGMNPHALQRILGHASMETTNKIYTNVGLDFVGDEGRALRDRKRR